MAIDFDGASTEYLSTTTLPTELSGSAEPFTWCAWVKAESLASNRIVLSIGDTASDRQHMLYVEATTGLVYMSSQNGGVFSATTSTGISAGAWHHVGGQVLSSTSRYAWIDGTRSTQNTQSRVVTSLDRLFIGAKANDTGPVTPFDGVIAEVGVWDVELTAGEMAAMAQGYSPLLIRPANLVTYWPLLDKAGPSIDRVGGFDMTWNNTPTVADHPRVIYPSSKVSS